MGRLGVVSDIIKSKDEEELERSPGFFTTFREESNNRILPKAESEYSLIEILQVD